MEKEKLKKELPKFVKTNLIGTCYFFCIPTDDSVDYSVRRIIILQAYDMLIIIHLPAKGGMQLNSGFSYIIPLKYTFKHPTKSYLNFTVELIVGEIMVEKGGKKYVQYSVELMDIIKAESS